ncbi:MAG TPA: fibronectin type III-like domain-contianing protein, partial [Vicinamibacteria bacterium]|nr:fibronectin type III-like domain-contianing protein [Vicinamibacteria bacterium]
GDEVVQAYVHQRVASVTRPVMQLVAFRRIHLLPGEKTTVELKLGPESMALLGPDMKPVVEPGVFDVMVGPTSAETTSVPLYVVQK